MLEIIFWFSAFAIVYAYFGYPLSLYLLSKTPLRKSFEWNDTSEYTPPVTIIIAACNEETKIQAKLDNTLALDYPDQKLEIIVASDASTDATNEIVSRYELATEGLVKLIALHHKGGKEAAQKVAVAEALGDIVVFTDASTTLAPHVLGNLVGCFSDPRVGGVDGMSKVLGESGEGAYLKYENKIREWEAHLGSTVSFGGCLFAARKNVLRDFAPDLQSDFRTALQTVTNGYQAIINRVAVAEFADVKNPEKEYQRKLRTVVRGINNVAHHLYLLNPFKYKLFSYQLFCHKVLKWLVPFFMISAYNANLGLVFFSTTALEQAFWTALAVAQFWFYIIAGIAWDRQSKNPYLKIMAFFTMSNLAILHAWVKYVRGERFVTWNVTER